MAKQPRKSGTMSLRPKLVGSRVGFSGREAAETTPYTTQPKANDGQERINPVRSQGESEVRLKAANTDFDGNWLQLLETMEGPKGYMTDINSDIFSSVVDTEGNAVVESIQNDLLKEGQVLQAIGMRAPLSDAEYFLRKQQILEEATQAEQLKIRQNYLDTLMGIRMPRFLVPDTTEFAFDAEARYFGLKLPYHKCLFILNPGLNARLVYCEQLGEDSVQLTLKVSTHGAEEEFIGQLKFHWDGEKLNEEGWFSEGFDSTVADEVRAVIAILDGLSKRYVVAEGEPPPEGRAIPEARKGCTVRVVKLHPNATEIRKAWQGGTHASPREHMRRGHWRTGAKGKKIWIGQLVVNQGKTDGVVDKSYYVRRLNAIAKLEN